MVPNVEEEELSLVHEELKEFFNRLSLKNSNSIMILNGNQKVQVFREVIKHITKSSMTEKQRFMFKKKLFTFVALASSEMPGK